MLDATVLGIGSAVDFQDVLRDLSPPGVEVPPLSRFLVFATFAHDRITWARVERSLRPILQIPRTRVVAARIDAAGPVGASGVAKLTIRKSDGSSCELAILATVAATGGPMKTAIRQEVLNAWVRDWGRGSDRPLTL